MYTIEYNDRTLNIFLHSSSFEKLKLFCDFKVTIVPIFIFDVIINQIYNLFINTTYTHTVPSTIERSQNGGFDSWLVAFLWTHFNDTCNAFINRKLLYLLQ